MKTILVLSPHLDDAAFSVAPFIAEVSKKIRVIVATAFTKSVLNPSGFALDCQLDKGLSQDVDYMALRRSEDQKWAKAMGILSLYGDFAEAPHRGYDSVEKLFSKPLDVDKVSSEMRNWFASLFKELEPDFVLCPLAIGHHVDHFIVRRVAFEYFDSMLPLLYFRDQPYAFGITNFEIKDYFDFGDDVRVLENSCSKKSNNLAMLAAKSYATQIPFQFKDHEKMALHLGEAWSDSIPLFYLQKNTKDSLPSYIFH